MENRLKIRARDSEKARELARQIYAVAADLRCGACGRRDFAMIETPEESLRTVIERVPANTQGDYGTSPWAGANVAQPAITLICTNCGHVEVFAEATIDADPEEYGEVVEP